MARGNGKGSAGGKHGRAARCAAGAPDARGSLYDEVTASIIAQLEEGVFPWVRPWSKAAARPGLPRNAVTGRAYSGINVLILWGAVIESGYPSQDWLTFRQALAAGGAVRKGEHGRTVFYADHFVPKGECEGSDSSEPGEEPRGIAFLKRFTVFNVAQCEGLPEGLVSAPAPLPERELHGAAEALIAATGADFRIGGAEAFYSPSGDYVQVPPQPAFDHQIDYYRTALHEVCNIASVLISRTVDGLCALLFPNHRTACCAISGRES